MTWANGVKFRVIAADPPWPYPLTGRIGSADARKHQPMHSRDGWFRDGRTLSIPELSGAVLPVADSGCLFLWCTSGNMPSALSVMSAWGYRYVANFVWVKTSGGVSGLCGEWTGYWGRMKHELVLFGVRGGFRRDTSSAPFDSVFLLPRVRGGHGAKPDEFYDVIQRAYAGPYLELFATKRRPGWFAYGDELEGGSDISVPEWDAIRFANKSKLVTGTQGEGA